MNATPSVIDRPTDPDPVTTVRGHCACGRAMPPVAFDARDANLDADVVRQRWPRLHWHCPARGGMAIVYASPLHYIAGDW